MSKQLLNIPNVFDIIISDFGREAAFKYVRSTAIIEREIIHTHLKGSQHKFYDELRRIMFVLVGDIAYYKRSLIDKYKNKKYLDSKILLGVGTLTVPEEVKKRIINCVLQEIYLAVTRGYNNIRIIIPCNTLSLLLERDLKEVLSDTELLYNSIVKDLCLDGRLANIYSRLRNTYFRVCPIPPIIMDDIYKRFGSQKNLLILGTTSGVQNYRAEVAKMKMLWDFSILDLSWGEQNLINKTVEAAIDEDKVAINQLKQKIDKEIIRPRQRKFNDLVVIEACTDFDLGLGINTREMFARRLVYDVYKQE